ncbi:hypothetical protein [Paraburkholderia sp. MM6662-R1]|uniref:hypothetical protein n=1 Tax=Paraburkholderia sp. MM6662-R1 TaxID=2991066 RepID=UPI003D1D5752
MVMHSITTENFNISYDDANFTHVEVPSVEARADYVATACEGDFSKLCSLFAVDGAKTFGPSNRILITFDKNIRGANNNGYVSPNASHITVNPEIGASNDFVMLLFVDEMSEILMGVIGKTVGSWDAGDSSGEGLSRVCGALLHPASAPVNVNAWLLFDPTQDTTAAVADDAFRKDWVTSSFKGGPLKAGGTVAGDQDSYSVGCAILFINYLQSQLDFPLQNIISAMPLNYQAGDSTLASMSKALTHADLDAYGQFRQLIDVHYPVGSAQLKTNNPFPLAVTSLAPCATGNSTGLFVFVAMPDGRIAYDYATQGKAFQGWQGIPGSLPTQLSLASATLGENIYVFSRGETGDIRFAATNGGTSFGPWAPVPGQVSLIPGSALSASGRPSELFLFAQSAEGAVLFNQFFPGGKFVGWQEVPGGLRVKTALATGMQDTTLFVFAVASDGSVQFNQAAAGGAFVGWQTLPGAPATEIPLCAVGRKGNLFVFLVGTDGQVHFNQAAPGGPFVGWQIMPGSRQTSVAVGAGMVNDNLFVFLTESDGRIVFNQAEPGGSFVGWQLLR